MSELYPWLGPLYQKLWIHKSWPSALLIYGGSDFGQGLLAERLAHALLCQQVSSEGESCGICPSCQWVTGGYHPDLHILGISRAGNTVQDLTKEEKNAVSVDDVRIMQELLSLTPHRQGLRIVVIPALEKLTLAAQNALLKSLEEPGEGILYLMASSELRSVAMTIRSRAIHEKISPPNEEVALNWLTEQGVENVPLMWALSGHSPLLAKELFAHNSKRCDWMHALTESPYYQAQVGELIQSIEPSLWLDWLHRWILDLVEQKLMGSVRFHLDFSDRAAKLASRINSFDLLAYEKYCRQTKRFLRHPLNARLLVEATLISYYQLF